MFRELALATALWTPFCVRAQVVLGDWIEALSYKDGVTLARWDDFYAGSCVAIPVTGSETALKASDVVVVPGNFTKVGTPMIRTEAQMWATYGKPIKAVYTQYPRRFTVDDGNWSNDDWADDHGGKYYELSQEVWGADFSDMTLDEGRQWILVPTKAPSKTARKGWKNFIVGLKSADVYYPVSFKLCDDQVRQKLPAVENYAELQVLPRPMGVSGKVSGGGFYVPGKTVTVKAVPTPTKTVSKKVGKTTVKTTVYGTVFAGWYADAECETRMNGAWQSTSYPLRLEETGERAIYARFLSVTNSEAKSISIAVENDFYVLEPGSAIETIPVVVESGCTYSVKASNLPAGLSLKRRSDDKSYYIAGKPTTPGEKVVTLKATNAANKTGTSIKIKLLVDNYHCEEIPVEDHYDNFIAGVPLQGFYLEGAQGCTVSIPKALGLAFDAKTGQVKGTPKAPGKYLVTITRRGERIGGTAKKPIYKVYKATTLFVVYQGTGYDAANPGVIKPGITIFAQIRDSQDSSCYDNLEACSTNEVYVGVNQVIPLSSVGMSNVVNTLKVSGLPAGLVFDTKKNRISGRPTKAGTFTVKVTATNKWKWTGSTSFVLAVKAIPSHLQGAFIGKSEWYRYTNGQGLTTVSVSSTGKVSGKFNFWAGHTVFTFSGTLDWVDEWCAEATVKIKGEKVARKIFLDCFLDPDFSGERQTGCVCIEWENFKGSGLTAELFQKVTLSSKYAGMFKAVSTWSDGGILSRVMIDKTGKVSWSTAYGRCGMKRGKLVCSEKISAGSAQLIQYENGEWIWNEELGEEEFVKTEGSSYNWLFFVNSNWRCYRYRVSFADDGTVTCSLVD